MRWRFKERARASGAEVGGHAYLVDAGWSLAAPTVASGHR